jgi:hypothetical protein
MQPQALRRDVQPKRGARKLVCEAAQKLKLRLEERREPFQTEPTDQEC